MRSLLLFMLPLLASAAIMGCQSGDASAKEKADEPKPMQGFTVTLECRELSGPDSETPSAEVALVIAGKRNLLDTISVCQVIEAADYPNHKMPMQTISACGGWWAGAGDYFYAYINGDKVVVMQGWQAEEQTDEGYHYEQVAEFPLQ